MIYELHLKPSSALTVESDTEQDAKQVLVDALSEWGITQDDVVADEMEEQS